MTEYDYSPEAYEQYIATQNRISEWARNAQGLPLDDAFGPNYRDRGRSSHRRRRSSLNGHHTPQHLQSGHAAFGAFQRHPSRGGVPSPNHIPPFVDSQQIPNAFLSPFGPGRSSSQSGMPLAVPVPVPAAAAGPMRMPAGIPDLPGSATPIPSEGFQMRTPSQQLSVVMRPPTSDDFHRSAPFNPVHPAHPISPVSEYGYHGRRDYSPDYYSDDSYSDEYYTDNAYSGSRRRSHPTELPNMHMPTIIKASYSSPIVVPINGGADGFVVIPPVGQAFQVLDQTNMKQQKYRPSKAGSFLGRMFGKSKRQRSMFKRDYY